MDNHKLSLIHKMQINCAIQIFKKINIDAYFVLFNMNFKYQFFKSYHV